MAVLSQRQFRTLAALRNRGYLTLERGGVPNHHTATIVSLVDRHMADVATIGNGHIHVVIATPEGMAAYRQYTEAAA